MSIPKIWETTVDYFLLKTERAALTEEELQALSDLNRTQVPLAVQNEIAKACTRYVRNGWPLAELTLGYIRDSMKNYSTKRRAQGKTAKARAAPVLGDLYEANEKVRRYREGKHEQNPSP